MSGAIGANLEIEVSVRGDRPLPDARLPELIDRTRIDLHTLDVNDIADHRWLRALARGDQPERLRLLDQEIRAAGEVPIRRLQGDGNLMLPAPISSLPDHLPVIVFHSHALNQFSPDARERYDRVLRAASEDRVPYRISMEGNGAIRSECVETCRWRVSFAIVLIAQRKHADQSETRQRETRRRRVSTSVCAADE